MASEKQNAHELLDRLDPSQLAAVTRLLEVMLDPLNCSIATAPVEDEQILPEMADAIDRARSSIERGEGISHDEIMREFGLTPRR